MYWTLGGTFPIPYQEWRFSSLPRGKRWQKPPSALSLLESSYLGRVTLPKAMAPSRDGLQQRLMAKLWSYPKLEWPYKAKVYLCVPWGAGGGLLGDYDAIHLVPMLGPASSSHTADDPRAPPNRPHIHDPAEPTSLGNWPEMSNWLMKNTTKCKECSKCGSSKEK